MFVIIQFSANIQLPVEITAVCLYLPCGLHVPKPVALSLLFCWIKKEEVIDILNGITLFSSDRTLIKTDGLFTIPAAFWCMYVADLGM